MDFLPDTDSENESGFNTEKNVKVYKPKELNDLLLTKTKEIASDYCEISIIGDIINFKKWKSSGCGFDVSMDDNKVSCNSWIRNGLRPEDITNYINTKCIVGGFLKAEYYYGHKFTLNVNSIKIQNNDTKLKELKSICDAKGYFKNKKIIDWGNIENIGIISKINTQGYDDFCNQFKVPLEITLEQITLEGSKTQKECIESIQRLQHCDVIIIVRGGGDTSEISNSFDCIGLFEAIKNSSVPIITAIGHEQDKDDRLLITNVSDLDFPTPTALAKDLNKKFFEPLIQKIDNLLSENEELFDDLIEKTNSKLYKALSCFIEDFLKHKFGGQIVEVKNDETNIIIKKDGIYYNQQLDFNDELQFTDNDLELKDSILEALDCEDIDIIKNNFKKLNVDNHALTSNILDNIKKIKQNNNLEEKFSETIASKTRNYYLKKMAKTTSFNNLIKIRGMLLWYKEHIFNGEPIKDVYRFIKSIN